MTARGQESDRIEGLKAGADDYISKPFTDDELLISVKRAVESKRLKEENRSLRNQQDSLVTERANLIEKNELARTRVEAMINRLKAIEVLGAVGGELVQVDRHRSLPPPGAGAAGDFPARLWPWASMRPISRPFSGETSEHLGRCR